MERYAVKLIMSDVFIINAESKEEAEKQAREKFGCDYYIDDVEIITLKPITDMRKIWKAQLNLCNEIAKDIIKHGASKEICKYADGFATIESPYGTSGCDYGNDFIRINFGEAYAYISINEDNSLMNNKIDWCNDEMGVENYSTYQGTLNDLEHMTIEEAYDNCMYPECYEEYANKENEYAKCLVYVPYNN